MNRGLRLAVFLAGAALFAFFVLAAGPRRLVTDAERTGWMIVPILLLYGVTYLLMAAAWRITLEHEPGRPSFWRIFVITVSGFSLDFLTPGINVGGEPFKVAALAPQMGKRRAGAAVILYQFVHTLGIVLATLAAIAVAMIVLPMPRSLLVLAFVSAVGLVLLAGLVFEASRRGVLARTFDLLARLPVLGRLMVRFARFRPALEAIDQQVSTFTLERKGAFTSAVVLEFVGRCLLLCEVFVILWTVGAPLSLAAAFGVDGFSSLIGNAIFFVPYELGTKEGALFLLTRIAGADPRLGVYASLVIRVRDMIWIAAGLLLIWAVGRRPEPQPS